MKKRIFYIPTSERHCQFKTNNQIVNNTFLFFYFSILIAIETGENDQNISRVSTVKILLYAVNTEYSTNNSLSNQHLLSDISCRVFLIVDCDVTLHVVHVRDSDLLKNDL